MSKLLLLRPLQPLVLATELEPEPVLEPGVPTLGFVFQP